jgi:cell division protein FtsZ
MIFGAVIDPEMGDEIRVTVIATGFERSGIPRRALERLPRTEKPVPASTPFTRSSESVSVGAETRSSADVKSQPLPSINNDDLDVPTFLRNRR